MDDNVRDEREGQDEMEEEEDEEEEDDDDDDEDEDEVSIVEDYLGRNQVPKISEQRIQGSDISSVSEG